LPNMPEVVFTKSSCGTASNDLWRQRMSKRVAPKTVRKVNKKN